MILTDYRFLRIIDGINSKGGRHLYDKLRLLKKRIEIRHIL